MASPYALWFKRYIWSFGSLRAGCWAQNCTLTEMLFQIAETISSLFLTHPGRDTKQTFGLPAPDRDRPTVEHPAQPVAPDPLCDPPNRNALRSCQPQHPIEAFLHSMDFSRRGRRGTDLDGVVLPDAFDLNSSIGLQSGLEGIV